MSCLEKEPDQRPQGFHAIVTTLSEIVANFADHPTAPTARAVDGSTADESAGGERR